MNVTDDHRRLRQRLHEEFGALEISPPPVLRVTGRGREIRTRRRALAIGSLVIVLAGGALSVHATGHKPAPPRVTVNAPGPGAPGAVFASGTADGKPWKLAVRNIAADPGARWCLPAVMLNGRYGDVLYPLAKVAQLYGDPAYLADIPGFPGVGAIFTQVKPAVTKVALAWPGGRTLTVRPVWVSGCGQRFHLAGFAFANANGVPNILTVSAYGEVMGLNLAPPGGLFGRTVPGVWANTDKDRSDIASSRDAQPIGTGAIGGQVWHIRAALGLFGQCYTATLRGGPGGGLGQGSECVAVSAPPRTFALSPLPVSSAHAQVSGYAGLVNPRTAYLEASVSDGTTQRVVPVRVTGRAYVAIVVPAGCELTWVSLFDASGRLFGQGRL